MPKQAKRLSGAGFGVWQPVHLPGIAEVVYGDQVVFVITGKDICGDLLPRTR